MPSSASGDAPAELFHRAVGSGPPVLVMHGGLGLDHTYFRPWLDPLGESVRLVYYDHRGNGRSPRPADWRELDHGSWAGDADDLRERLGHETVIVFGHSYGGFIALEHALRHPERLDGLVLCDTAPALDYPEIIAENARRRGTDAQVAAVEALLAGPVADDDALARGWRAVLPLYFRDPDPDVLAAMHRETRYSHGAFNRAFFGCVPEYDVTERLGEIDVPTLILGGRFDWIVPPAQGPDRLRTGIPHAELEIFEESGHFPFIEERERFLETVRAWLRRIHPAVG